MAITIERQPGYQEEGTGFIRNNFNPAYNPIKYRLDSTNKNKPGHRYITQVKSLESGNPVLFEKTNIGVTQAGGGKRGEVSIHRELQDYVDFYYTQGIINAVGSATNAHFGYKVEFGEEWFEEWEWSDFGFVPNSEVSTYDYNPDNLINATMLFITVSQGQEPPYSIGDKIFVTLNTGTQDAPEIAGVKEVLKVEQTSINGIQSYKVVLNMAWVGSGSSTGGNTRYADNRKTRFLGVNTELPIQTVFNGVLKFGNQEFNNWISQDYVLALSERKILSQLYDGYRVRENSRCYINFRQEESALGSAQPYLIRFYNDSGEIYEFILPESQSKIRTINVGTSRTDFGTLITGNGDLIKPTTKSYSFEFRREAGGIASKRYYITIDRSCPVDEVMELHYMDRLGSILPWYFTLMNVETHNINRDKYTRHNGNWGADSFRQQITIGGEEIYNSDYTVSHLLRTDWLNDKDAKFFHNVMESPVTFLNVGDFFNRCNIETNSVEVKKEKWYELKRYEVRVTMSHKENLNI